MSNPVVLISIFAVFVGLVIKLRHAAQSTSRSDRSAKREALLCAIYSRMDGQQFEAHLKEVLLFFGYGIQMTKIVSGFGSDFVVMKKGRKIVIQAKNWNGSVGIDAVYRVSAAVGHYGGDEGWVVIGSTFTAAAKQLAHRYNVRLIDGCQLKRMLEGV